MGGAWGVYRDHTILGRELASERPVMHRQWTYGRIRRGIKHDWDRQLGGYGWSLPPGPFHRHGPHVWPLPLVLGTSTQAHIHVVQIDICIYRAPIEGPTGTSRLGSMDRNWLGMGGGMAKENSVIGFRSLPSRVAHSRLLPGRERHGSELERGRKKKPNCRH